MNTTWHKLLFFGVLFVAIVILNVQPQAQEVITSEDRTSRLATADRARLLPRERLAEEQFKEEELPREVAVSESQALLPLNGGPLEQGESKQNGELSLNTSLALVVDIESGERLYQINTDRRWPLASLSKIMTAVVSKKFLPKEEVLKITAADFSPLDPSEFHSLNIGDSFAVEDLIRAMMVGSSNQAAEALARASGREEFIAAMRQQALDWGMSNTYFGDPAGLSSVNQSTLDDLEVFMGHVWREHRDILSYSRFANISLADAISGKSVIIYAIHRFADQANFLGGKTGYTDVAKENLVSVFDVNGRPILIAVMGSSDRFGDTDSLLKWTKNRLSNL